MSIAASNFEWNGSTGHITVEKLRALCGGTIYECIEVVSDRTGKKIVFQDPLRQGTYHSHSEEAFMIKVSQVSESFPLKTRADMKNKYFVLTGILSEGRREVQDLILQRGGYVQNGVNTKTNYLVVGSEPGANKLGAARLHGTVCLDGIEFEKFLKSI